MPPHARTIDLYFHVCAQREWFQVATGNSGRYDQMGIQVGYDKTVIFELDASNDGHVGFFTAARSYKAMYEIVISGWGNTKSVIRRRNQGPAMVEANTKGLLRVPGSYTQLWADAKDGLVRLGRGKVVGKEVILKWQDPRKI